ncbi:CaiB/BaiF CoA transferase family protein [Aeromicrobium sp. CTD01-1L150]|uniref:CaiB/BaiF CoA transferase family protein n=1 Tax=Aeromicrobium sp. CTD01-1L150 TaxID=3341830 RepID=UPI0035C248FC
MRPLEHLRVLEIGQYIAAPYCSLMFADQGAEVVKLERPGSGDPRRAYDPRVGHGEESLSGGFLTYNRGKRSLALDLREEEDRSAFLRLLPDFDVVVENLRPGAMERLGLGWDVLEAAHPGLVYCAISGFGRSDERRGKFAGRPAFDTSVQATGGLMSVIGEAGGPPLPSVTGFADIYTGVHAAFGIMSALAARQRTGRGAFVDVSMYDCVSSLMERELMLHDFTGELRERGVDRYAPVGTLAALDGYVALILPTDEMWHRFCAAIGRSDLVDDPRFATVLDRARVFGTLVRTEAEQWTRTRTRAEVVEALTAAGVPVGEVQEVGELYECEHLQARGMFLRIADPEGGERRVIRTPVVLEGFESPASSSVPVLGEMTSELLASGGLGGVGRGGAA